MVGYPEERVQNYVLVVNIKDGKKTFIQHPEFHIVVTKLRSNNRLLARGFYQLWLIVRASLLANCHESIETLSL